MRIRPIPKHLLIHSAELITVYDPDKWGNGAMKSVSLEHVRIEPSHRQSADTSGAVIQAEAVLIYDVTNSAPKDVSFALCGDRVNEHTVKLQQVRFGGRLYTVHKVDMLFSGSGLHHIEVMLV